MKKDFIFVFAASVCVFLTGGCACGPCASDAPVKAKVRRTPIADASCDRLMCGAAPAGAYMEGNSFKAPAGRQMAFTAYMRLNVSNVKDAIVQTRSIALESGGFVKRLDDASIIIAVPVGKADEVMKSLGKTGVVASLRIEGEDVTEQVTDVRIRLENLEKSRTRLLALMGKAGKVDELLKVEQELTRVTTEIEKLETAQKELKSRVNFVTVTVTFSRIYAERPANFRVPVQWINELGNGLLNESVALHPGKECPLFDVRLPEGFVLNGKYMAISGDNCRICFNEYANAVTKNHWYGNDYAAISFYGPMIEKSLKEKFHCEVAKGTCVIDGKDGVVFTVKPVFGGRTYVFRVAAVVDKDMVKVISVSAPEDAFNRNFPGKVWDDFIASVDL